MWEREALAPWLEEEQREGERKRGRQGGRGWGQGRGVGGANEDRKNLGRAQLEMATPSCCRHLLACSRTLGRLSPITPKPTSTTSNLSSGLTR